MWKDLPCLWMRRLHIVKLAILPTEIYIFNAFLTQVPDSELQTRVIKWMPFPVRIQVLPCPFSLPFWSRIHESHLHGILSSINSDQKAFYFSWLSKFCCAITVFLLTWTGADADVFIHVMVVRLFVGKYLCKLFALSIFFAIVAMTNLLEFNFISAFQLPCCTAFVSTEWPLSLELPRELAEHPPIILCPIRFYPHFHLSGPSYTSCMLWYMVWKEAKLCESFLVLCVGVQHKKLEFIS